MATCVYVSYYFKFQRKLEPSNEERKLESGNTIRLSNKLFIKLNVLGALHFTTVIPIIANHKVRGSKKFLNNSKYFSPLSGNHEGGLFLWMVFIINKR